MAVARIVDYVYIVNYVSRGFLVVTKQAIIVQSFYQEYWVNLTLIATKANSIDVVSLLCPQ